MEVLLALALKMTELLTKDAQACRVGGERGSIHGENSQSTPILVGVQLKQ